MASIVKINKHIQYQSQYAIYFLYAGETRTLEFINENFASHIVDAYLKDGTLELFQSNEIKKEVPVVEIQDPAQPENQDDTQQTLEIMYKTTQSIQDKNGNEIEVDTQLTAEEFKKKGFTKKKLEALIQDEKVIELKIVK